MRITYNASIQSVETEETSQAIFYLMNTTPNRNRWGVTDKALQEALPTINKKTIGCGPDYKIDQHYPNPLKVGHFTSAEKPDGYAVGTAAITDPVVWQKLVDGEWGPISVVITSYLERCSYCRANLTNEPDPFTHPCIARGEAHLEIQSFVFDRVDFVDVPAYPQAGFINQASARTQIPLELLANLYNGGNSNSMAQGSQLNNQEMKKEMETEKLQQEITDLEHQLSTEITAKEETEKKVTELELQLSEEKTAKEQAENELTQLKTSLHKEAVDQILEARTKAGLTQDPETERLRLTEYTSEFLEQLKADAQKIISAQLTQSNNPKAKNQTSDQTELEAAMNETRVKLFGYRRETQ